MDMPILAVLAPKGGTGKTSICLHLAAALAADGLRCTILDLDPQASACAWHAGRPDPMRPAVRPAHARQLPRLIRPRPDTDLLILDTAPHLEAQALAAAQVATLALVASRPSVLDLRTMGPTLDLCAVAGVPAGLLLTQAVPRSLLAQQAQSVLADQVQARPHCQVAPSLGHRVDFAMALTASQGITEWKPRSAAARELRALAHWVRTRLAL